MMRHTRNLRGSFVVLFCVVACLNVFVIGCSSRTDETVDAQATGLAEVERKQQADLAAAEQGPVVPWDYDPYKVLVWILSDDPNVNAATLQDRVDAELAKDFNAIWRVAYADAPASVVSAVRRDSAGLDFESLAAADPVIAVKRDHPEAIRMRTASDLPEHIGGIFGNPTALANLRRRGLEAGDETLAGIDRVLKPLEGTVVDLVKKWDEPSTEAILVNRGVAATLIDPGAKIVSPPISNLVLDTANEFDKIFIVEVFAGETPGEVRAMEFDSLMRYFSPPTSTNFVGRDDLPTAIGRCVTDAFSPVVRIDDAGSRRGSGYVRAGGLISDPDSPARIRVGDVLRPMIRKNDQNGRPILLGAVDWAYVLVKEADNRICNMDIHAGRSGGLSVRLNNRTFRVALKVHRPLESTELRLHARGDVDSPLIGYEIHERELDSKDMTFVGRTDWNGRLVIEKTNNPLRLFYVKNGGAVLARMPMVPGMLAHEVADMGGDDMRLKAEAYVRGKQNAIIDLVATRELLAARIRLRLKRDQLQEAKDLLVELRDLPTNKTIADDLSRRQDEFLKAIGRNANQRRKVDDLFATSRDILMQFINGRLVSELEAAVIAAEQESGE